MLAPIQWLLVIAIVTSAIAAVIDWRTEQIPNWLTLGGIAIALIARAVLAVVFKLPILNFVGFGILGAVACSIVPIMLYRAGAGGGGDVKLLAAVGAFAGLMAGIEIEFYAFIAGVLFAPAMLIWEGRLLHALGNSLAIVVNPFRPKAKRKTIESEQMSWMRFGPFVFVGAIVGTLIHWRDWP